MPDISNVADRLALFQIALIGTLVLACLWESFAPARQPTPHAPWRWLNNFVLAVFNHGVLLMALPVAYATLAPMLGWQGGGVLQRWDVHPVLAFGVLFLGLEFIAYVSHRLFHAVPVLWRLHAVHHCDTELDFSTAYRHHTLEVLLTALVTLPFVLLLGPDIRVLVAYQVLASVVVVVSHTNVSLGAGPNKVLKWLVVTPDYHRVHHSAERRYTNSNYGTVSPVFDHVFGTATPLAQVPGQDMALGLEYFREPRFTRLDRLLVIPFLAWPRKKKSLQPP